MTRKLLFSALAALLLSGSASGQNLVELFQKAKQEIKASAWTDALKTLDQLDTESQKPGLEAQRKQVEPALALYRGVAFANLGQSQEAKGQFEAYLATNPNASLDSGTYSKKAIAAMDDARKSRASGDGGMPSLGAAYKSFRVAESAAKEPPLPQWADGPARFLLKPEEKKEWAALKDSVARTDFIERFWAARDPTPGTFENESRQEFERRVAFADERFGQGEVSGSMTDRGMVFVLLGPPTYAGRKPIGTGDDTADSQGLSSVGRHDSTLALKGGGGKTSTSSQNSTADQFGGPGKKVLDAANNWREVWHYRKEVLPAGVPYQQVDFEFVTRKGYGENVLQRDSAALSTMDKAKQKFDVPRASS